MALSTKKNTCFDTEKSPRLALESIPDNQMNSKVLINSPTSKQFNLSKDQNWSVLPKVFARSDKKATLPKASTEFHMIPYTFSPKSNSLSSRGKSVSTGQDAISSYITQIPKSAENTSEKFYKEHLFNTFQALKLIKKLPQPDKSQLKLKKLKIPKKPGFRKTIVFDLDETLVHCVDSSEQCDIFITISIPTGEVVQVGVNIRPFAQECLKAAAKDFEVIVFTASHRCYADAVLDFLDPEGSLIHYRLYRENCLMVRNMYIKDLRILKDRKMRDIVIVDNAAYSFAYQLENGVPIISWHNDPSDRELFNLIDYLQVLSKAKDVREVNRNVFRMTTFYEDYIEEYLKVKTL